MKTIIRERTIIRHKDISDSVRDWLRVKLGAEPFWDGDQWIADMPKKTPKKAVKSTGKKDHFLDAYLAPKSRSKVRPQEYITHVPELPRYTPAIVLDAPALPRVVEKKVEEQKRKPETQDTDQIIEGV